MEQVTLLNFNAKNTLTRSVVLACLLFANLLIMNDANATDYYLKAGSVATANLATSYNTATNGTGTDATSFSTGNNYIVQTGQAASWAAAATIPSGAELQIQSACTLTITAGNPTIAAGATLRVTGNIVVNSGRSITVAGNIIFPTDGVRINGAGSLNITGTMTTVNTTGVKGANCSINTSGNAFSIVTPPSFVFNGTSPQGTVGMLATPSQTKAITIDNTSGVTLSSNIDVSGGSINLTNGVFTISSSATLTIEGTTVITRTNGSIDNSNGTIFVNAFSGNTTTPAGTFSANLKNLSIQMGSNTLEFIVNDQITITGTLTLHTGLLNTSAGLVTLATTSTVTRTNGWVKGPAAVTLPASLVTGSTYNFPIGKSVYRPLLLVNPTTTAGSNVVVKAEVFDGNSGGTPDVSGGVGSINITRYWSTSILANAGNLSGSKVRLTEDALGRDNASLVAYSATVAGTYSSVGQTLDGVNNTITSNDLTSSYYNPGFFVMAKGFNDGAIIGFTTASVCDVATVNITVYNNGANTLTSLDIDWSVAGNPQPQANVAVNIPSATSAVVALGTYSFSSPGTLYSTSATLVQVNGVADANTVNNTASTNIPSGLAAGTYTVGSGGNYTTITAAVSALNTYGVCGSVTFLLTNSSTYTTPAETFPIRINVVKGGSSANTVTFKPAASTTVNIEANGGVLSVSNMALIDLNACSYVTFDGSNVANGTSKNLTISNTSNNNVNQDDIGTLMIRAGASNNTIKNCIIKGSARGSVFNVVDAGGVINIGEYFGSTSRCNNNSILNNDISNFGSNLPNYGVVLQTPTTSTTANYQTGNIVSGNRIMNFGFMGVSVGQNNSNWKVLVNEIFHQTGITAATTLLSGISDVAANDDAQLVNSIINGNYIHDLRSSATGTAGGVKPAVTGILTGGDGTSGTSIVSNNVVIFKETNNHSYRGITATNSNLGSGVNTHNIVFNTVYIGGANSTSNNTNTGGTGSSAAFWRTGGTATVLKNNILINVRTGGNSAQAANTTQVNSGNFGIVDQRTTTISGDYNDIYVANLGAGGTFINFYGWRQGVGRRGFWDNWNTSTSSETNSIHVGTVGQLNGILPNFVDLTNGNLHLVTSNNCALDGAAIPALNVNKDMDSLTTGDTRHATTPDIGADEFTSTFAPVASSNSPVCVGGSISLSASGGTTYSWAGPAGFSSTSQNPTRTNATLAMAGTYTTTVINSSCTGTATTTVVVNQPSLAPTHVDVTCNGGSDGSIDANGSGNGPFTYLWSNSETTASISGLMAGTYTVIITDIQGCTNTASITVAQPAVLSASANSTSTVCFGESNGSVSSSPSGGTAPFNYLWSTGATTSTVSGLAAGTYSVTITDNCGSTATATTTVTEPAVLNANLVVNHVTCNGGNNGSASTSLTGGTSPYAYLWSSGGTGTSVSGLTAGTYVLVIQDNHNCVSNNPFTVNEPTAIVPSCSGTDVSCNGGSNGSASVSSVGGTGGHTYLWSNGSTNLSISGLSAGTYSVTVTDASGCTASCSHEVIQPAALNLSCGGTNNICYNGSIGTASVTPSGGTSPYAYLWSNSSTDNSISGLSAGTYSVTVTDQNGCTNTCSYEVTQPPLLTVTAGYLSPACDGSDLYLTSTVNGGTGTYTYAWSGPNGTISPVANPTITSATNANDAGNYLVTVTDANGCVAGPSAVEVDVHLTPSGALFANTNADFETTICVGNGGTLMILLGGSGTITGTLWDGVSTTLASYSGTATQIDIPVTPPVGTTIYYLQSMHDQYCAAKTVDIIGVDPVTVHVLASPTVDITTPATTELTCTTTSILLETTTDFANTYLWTPNGETTEDITVTLPGTYVVTGTETTSGYGCTGSDQIVITQNITPPTLSIDPPATTELTCVVTSILLNTSGTSVSYLWNTGATTASITVSTPGTYSLTSTGTNGCTNTASIVITQNITAPTATITPSGATTFCSGGSVTLDAGAAGYSGYLWSNSATTQTVLVSTSGTYTVTVTSANGCTATSAVTTVTVNICNTALNLKLYIQGYYSGSGLMQPVLFNQTIGASGTETDTILVELRDEFNTSNVIASAKGLLMTNGTVLSIGGSGFEFSGAHSGNYWIAVKHRNALETWSSSAVSFATTPTYDFSSAANKALYDNQALVDGGMGLYGFYSGDIIADGFIGIDDVNLTNNDNLAGLFFDYLATDINGDGFVGIDDVNIVNNNNLAGVFFLP